MRDNREDLRQCFGDAARAPRPTDHQLLARVDTVVANLPFGRRLGQRIHHYWFAVDLLSAIARLTEPGARVVLHEQSPLPAGIDPRLDLSLPVIAPEALTVAHVWRVD